MYQLVPVRKIAWDDYLVSTHDINHAISNISDLARKKLKIV